MLEELHLINKAINENNYNLLLYDNIDETYFFDYKDIYQFLLEYYREYRNLPDTYTIAQRFESFESFDVKTDIDYIVTSLRNYKRYIDFKDILISTSEAIQGNEELGSELEIGNFLLRVKDILNNNSIKYYDANKEALKRYKEEKEKVELLKTGIEKLDNLIYGLRKGEELFTIYARTGVGKTYLILHILNNINLNTGNVGFITSEMQPETLSYRLDTINFGVRNSDLMRQNYPHGYKEFLENLQNRNSFLISMVKDFGKKLTTTKLENYITQNKLECLAIDGIRYITNERGTKYQAEHERLAQISEDLMQLSINCKIPIIVAVQANRMTYDKNESNVDLRAIRDSDAISHNSTRTLALSQSIDDIDLKNYNIEENKVILRMQLTKNRYGRLSDNEVFSADFNNGKIEWIATEKGNKKKGNIEEKRSPKRIAQGVIDGNNETAY